MKIFFAVFLSIFASSNALVDPAVLFGSATNYQALVTSLQNDIVTKITSLRFNMSSILKRTSNITLDQIQDNLMAIFELEQPVRLFLFEGNPTMDPCMVSLRNRLNLVTEGSGYSSSNCARRYDTAVTNLVANAYQILEEYEDLIAVIQMIVLNAFNDRNIWTKNVEIADKFTATYNEHLAKWEDIQVEVANFLGTMETDIVAFNAVLGECFNSVQANLQQPYAQLIDDVEICREFNQ